MRKLLRDRIKRLRNQLGERLGRRMGSDAGMTTAEYAMGTIAACAFAALLYKIINSGAVSGALESVIGKALDVPF
ncbi:DUF4244 domain-containing protein [Streptomyces purpureus]|uniref:DUF4244 domain-containing protein n=1 Tax=Streptomyces purpureus TaxID=1951 RepID=A0A918H5B7_9ACTN|nr:DUF4244 domain-containing protein [Streptomyces purpureus]GGT38317.1 hypothetical protein GCM10014713_35090 [Streptomyces purpureus]